MIRQKKSMEGYNVSYLNQSDVDKMLEAYNNDIEASRMNDPPIDYIPLNETLITD